MRECLVYSLVSLSVYTTVWI